MPDRPRVAPAPALSADGALWVDMHTLAAATGKSYHNVAGMASRGTLPAHLFPSDRHAGKQLTRIAVHRLEPALQREIQRYLSRFGSISPDACLAEIENQYGADAMGTARRRWQAIQQYRAIDPKTVVDSATGRRRDSDAVQTLCAALEIDDSCTLRRWMARFDAALGSKTTAESLRAAFIALLPGKPGRVKDPDDDGRIKLGVAERLAIQGMWAERAQPDMESIWRDLLGSCLRCHGAAMKPVQHGFRGRYKVHRCPACNWSIAYRTVCRVIRETPANVATMGREGLKAFDDKCGAYAVRDWSQVGRSEMIFGDHHECDLFIYDPNRLTRDGKPVLFRPWLSAWMDIATDCVAYHIDARANGELLGLAFRSYVRRFGRPDIAVTDNGLDYLGKRFVETTSAIGTHIQRTLPSKRGGESHARSKPVERFFGTLERDCIQRLPGWIGNNPAVRKSREDVLYPMEKQHEEWVRTGQGASPFLSVDQFRDRCQQYIEGQYHKLPISRTDKSPLDAFDSDARPLHLVPERDLDLLLLEARTRKIGRNGVAIDRHWYYSPDLAGYVRERCQVRIDPNDRSKLVVIVAGRVILAYARQLAGLTSDDIKREAQIKRHQRNVAREALDIRRALAAGITPLDQVLAEKAEQSAPAALAAGAVPVVTPVSRLARAASASSTGSAGIPARRPPSPIATSMYDLTHSDATEEPTHESDK